MRNTAMAVLTINSFVMVFKRSAIKLTCFVYRYVWVVLFFNTKDRYDIHMGTLNKTSKIIYKVRPETEWKKPQTVFGLEQLL